MADFTKAQGQILDWTLLDDTASDDPSTKTSIQTKAAEMEQNIVVTVCHNDTTDAGTTPVTVSLLARVGSNDEAWHCLLEVQATAGQAVAETLNANSGVSDGDPEQLHVADTTDWDTGEPEWLFLKDTGNLVDSCLVLVTGWSDNAHYNCAWELERDYDNTDILHDKVSQFPMQIPAGYQNWMVVFHNSDTDATYAVRVDYADVTDLE